MTLRDTVSRFFCQGDNSPGGSRQLGDGPKALSSRGRWLGHTLPHSAGQTRLVSLGQSRFSEYGMF